MIHHNNWTLSELDLEVANELSSGSDLKQSYDESEVS